MAMVKFKPDIVVKETAKTVREETGVELLDYLLDVEECAIIDWTDEFGHIDIEGVCDTIEDAGYCYINFYKEAQKVLEVTT